MKKLFAILVSAISISTIANAGFLIEPEVGYAMGTQLNYTFGGTSYSFNSTSIPVGLRVAWLSQGGFWIGLQGNNWMSGTFTGATGTTLNDSYSRITGGLEMGFMAKNFKVYVGYDAVNKLTITPDVGNTNSPIELSGTGLHMGLGYYLKPHLGVSLLYSTPTYTTGAKGNASYSTLGTGNYTNISDSSMALLFTFPFSNK